MNAPQATNPATATASSTRRNSGPWVAWAVVAVAVLLFVAPWSPPVPSILDASLAGAAPRSLSPVMGWIAHVTLAAVWRGLLVLVIGGAAASATAALRLPWWAQAAIVVALCGLPVVVRWPSRLGLDVLPVAMGLGVWAWCSVWLVRRHLIGSLAWFGASGLAFAAALAVLFACLIESTPRVTDVPAITQEDRARLEQMLKLAGEQKGEHAELRLSAADLTRIAAAWLASRSADTRVAFDGPGDRLQCQATQRVFGSREQPAYLNVVADMRPAVTDGMVDPGLRSLRIGRVTIPAALAARLSTAFGNEISRTPEAGRMVRAIGTLSFAAGELLVVADPDRASSAFAASMASSSRVSDDLRADVREIMRNLVDECSTLPVGDERFIGLVRKAFEAAARRSTAMTAAERNRAALVALAIQIGDPRLRRLAGFPANEDLPSFRWDFDDQVTLGGRNDLARHFVVSGALRALATRDISMTMGLFKEQLDAVDGGTGFSFTDIAADMAGLRFADKVLEPSGAARMQERIQAEISVAALLPSLESLSDGLSQVMFERLYGSLTDERYRMVIRVISHRMEACSLLTTGQP
jgi:hypothetical protein